MDQVHAANLRIESKTENLSKVRDFMNENVTRSPLPDTERNKVILAVDEAVANIIRHAYEEEIVGEINIDFIFDPRQVEIVIQDSGNVFNPEDITDVDIMDHVKRGRKTGLGIFLMRQIMDEVKYAFREGKKNELRMIKYVSPPEQGGAKGA